MPEIEKTKDISTSKWIIILIGVALFTIAILFFVYNPDTIEKVWLWIIGLFGPIIASFKKIFESFAKMLDFGKTDRSEIEKSDTNSNQIIKNLNQRISQLENELKNKESDDHFDGITITVLRYFDDGETTLGLMFLEDKFYCYTLEDAYHKEKVPGKTRIPEGTYKLNFRREETNLTKTYRKTRPWFDYHLEIKNVPDFSGVYIHSGSTHEHTKGCLLIADSLTASSTQRMIFNSRNTFEKFYKYMKPKLDQGEYARIKICDENWFKKKLV